MQLSDQPIVWQQCNAKNHAGAGQVHQLLFTCVRNSLEISSINNHAMVNITEISHFLHPDVWCEHYLMFLTCICRICCIVKITIRECAGVQEFLIKGMVVVYVSLLQWGTLYTFKRGVSNFKVKSFLLWIFFLSDQKTSSCLCAQ